MRRINECIEGTDINITWQRSLFHQLAVKAGNKSSVDIIKYPLMNHIIDEVKSISYRDMFTSHWIIVVKYTDRM